jgi:glycosyltransferase involved in cell wall biosynthesis
MAHLTRTASNRAQGLTPVDPGRHHGRVHPPPRLLILIVAYNAEATLSAVLDRIPASVLDDFECEVLVIDDASTDATFDTGLAYRASRPDLPLTVLRNATNQGYGGNQKLGYRYAATEGYDYVALVHGDGQYAPEELPRLLEPLTTGQADAVFGSRMMVRGAARRGGMPLYKLVGNRILSRTQNALAGSRLSEWHSGYRIYRVSQLEAIRYTANSDDFSFDSQIILQLLSADARITELAIPTFYGDEICRVNGIRYAAQVVRAGVRHLFHRCGLLQQRSLQPVGRDNRHYADKAGFVSSHSEALARVTPGSRVLDLGAGTGALASAMADLGVVVDAADKVAPVVHDTRVSTLRVDLDEPLEVDLDPYDTVLMLDVVGHLADPEDFMERLRLSLGPRRREVVLTTANVAFVVTRLMLALGQFNYSEAGILDRSHTRLFTFRTIRRMLDEAGYDVVELKGIPAPFPIALRTVWLGRLLLRLNQVLIAVAPRLFAYQILVVARSRPHVDQVLAQTRASGLRVA